MICKECLHFEACTYVADFFEGQLDENSDEVCNHFRDLTKMIELPCKMGDTVWVCDPDDDVSGYIFLGSNEDYAFLGSGINGSFNVDDICQYGFEQFKGYEKGVYVVPLDEVHLTKEEAEQVLKERE